jgi:hypothetical protein
MLELRIRPRHRLTMLMISNHNGMNAHDWRLFVEPTHADVGNVIEKTI